MPGIRLSSGLREEYEGLFVTCAIRPTYAELVERAVDTIQAHIAVYREVGDHLGIPWHVVAALHSMESSCDFSAHLHNGDPLTDRTTSVPRGRPKSGSPPFTWNESAFDALTLRKLPSNGDWSIAGTLYQLEGYNGWGYRLYHPHVRSPYLWSLSNHYTSGKYRADGVWSESLASKQCGAAVLLRRMAEHGYVSFVKVNEQAEGDLLVVSYSMVRSEEPRVRTRAEALQRWLNTFPGIFLKEDGVPGPRTSDAYRLVVGSHLPGDPRG
jgi:lysozyme family protein